MITINEKLYNKMPEKIKKHFTQKPNPSRDEVVSLFPSTESGKMTSEHQRHTDGSRKGIYGKFDKEHPLSETYGDSGSASVFFYTAKASQEERNYGLSG